MATKPEETAWFLLRVELDWSQVPHGLVAFIFSILLSAERYLWAKENFG